MQVLAKELAVVLIVPLFERQAAGIYRNSAAVIDADGSLLGVYRKMHIPDDPLFYEKYYFTPGDGHGFKVWKTRYATIGVLICWDQWYPEAARITSLLGAQVLFYPTAIGWHPAEKDEWGAAQVDAWRTTQRAHAIANGVYVAAPNRVGHEDEPGTKGITFFGRSFIADPVRTLPCGRRAKVKRCSSRAVTRRSSKTSAGTGRFSAIGASTRTRRFSAGISARDRAGPSTLRMPAEWEPHRATWISWPHHEPDWPGKLGRDPMGLRGDHARARRSRAGRDPLPQRGGPRRCARDARRARRAG